MGISDILFRFSGYIPQAMSTAPKSYEDLNPRIMQAFNGVMEEIKELKECDADVVEETGDILWYTAMYIDETGIDVLTTLGLYSNLSLNEKNLLLTQRFNECSDRLAKINEDLIRGMARGRNYVDSLFNAIIAWLFHSMVRFMEVSDYKGDRLVTFDDIVNHNLSKLGIRYKDGFSEEACEDRADKQ